jgi:KUP system potassium uptake protein
VLGSVLLVVTGAEALYADMGHFGRRPIRIAWLAIAGPCLLLCYLGQAALLLERPEAIENPFFLMAPPWATYPLVLLATMASVIASQAIISGVFSLSQQALRLGYQPRVEILHSSAHEIGQVYVPVVNWLLFVATILLVLGFGSSAELAGAYGIAVVLTMVVTTILVGVCARRRWGWSRPAAFALTAAFLAVDLSFLGAASTKILEGGWVPLAVAAVTFLAMTTWRRGADLIDEYASAARIPVEYFLADLDAHPLRRVPGTAIAMDARGAGVPRTLLHNIKHNKMLHERVVLLTIPHGRRSARPPGRQAAYPALPRRFRPHHRDDRVHGKSERTRGLRAGERAGARDRHRAGDVLLRTRDARHRPAQRLRDVAQVPVRFPVPQLVRRLPAPGRAVESRDRDRAAGGNLALRETWNDSIE